MMPQVAAGIPLAAVVYKIMNKHTIDNMDIGACYSVTCTSAATVTAKINGATATLLFLPAGGSGAFFAPADSVCVETEGEFRVLPTEAPAPVIGAAGGGSAPVVVDPVPVEGSSNAVASGGVYDAIAAVSPPEGNVARLASENTFTAAQTFHAPVTVGVPRVEAVWAKASTGSIPDNDMRKAGTITDNAGHTLELPADSTRTRDGFAKAISDSELGLTVTHVGTSYTLYESSSPAGQEGTLGNTRKVYLEGFSYSSKKTLSLSGGKDGVAEVGHPMMLNGNVYIGHGPEGVKARCYFGITAAYLAKAGTITDNDPSHPLSIELPEDPARTIDSCIAEINEQGYKLEVKASKYNATNIYLEATETGSAPNGIVFTHTGCFSTSAAGTAQTTTQGSYIQGLDEGSASEWELRQNGYPVASRQTNNVYEGVQVFNNAVALNGNISGASLLECPADKAGALMSAAGVCRTVFNEFFDVTDTYGPGDKALTNIATLMPGYKDRSCLDILLPNVAYFAFASQTVNCKRIRIYAPSMIGCSSASGYAFCNQCRCPELEEFIVWAPAYISTCNRMFFNWWDNPKLMYTAVYLDSVKDATGFAFGGGCGKHITIYVPKATKATAFSEGVHTAHKTLKLTTGPVTNCENMLRYWGGLEDLIWNGVGQDGTRMANPVQFVAAGTGVFSGCAVLPASKFPKSWPSLSSARDIFLNCSLLDAATANAILDSLPDWSMEETPADHTITFTGTAAATAWAEEGADLSHVEAAEAKGWTVER